MSEREDAAPPGGGQMTRDVMQRAAEVPLAGPGATDTLAASGGLELRGRAGEGNTADQQADRAHAARTPPETLLSIERLEREQAGGAMEKDPIPGEREPDTAMGTQPGIVGTTGVGMDLPESRCDPTLDEATARDRAIEGGGASGAAIATSRNAEACEPGNEVPRPGPDTEAQPGERWP